MRPVARAALAAAAFAALSSALGASGAGRPRAPKARTLRLAASVAPPLPPQRPERAGQDVENTELSAVCPPGELPDDGVCVRFGPSLLDAPRAIAIETGAGRDDARVAPSPGPELGAAAVRRSTSLEEVPRRDDRPADLDAYGWPVTTLAGAPRLGSGDDFGGGVDLPVVGGEEVTVVKLLNQKGQTRLFVVEPMEGGPKDEPWSRVVTHHVIHTPGEEPRDWLVLVGPLRRLRDDRAVGTALQPGDALGLAAAGALHVEVREVREGLDLASLAGEGLRADDRARRVDPRNVFPVRTAR